MLELTAGPNPVPDFEEALRVIKLDETHYVGAHPLRLPVTGGRGIWWSFDCTVFTCGYRIYETQQLIKFLFQILIICILSMPVMPKLQ